MKKSYYLFAVKMMGTPPKAILQGEVQRVNMTADGMYRIRQRLIESKTDGSTLLLIASEQELTSEKIREYFRAMSSKDTYTFLEDYGITDDEVSL